MPGGRLRFDKVHVLAGAHVDMVATFAEQPVMAASNPASFAFMAGGGGLNIATALASLSVPVRLVAPVGTDANGMLLRETCDERGIEAVLVESARHPTGIYAGLFTPSGELTIGAADLRQNELIDERWIDAHFLPGVGASDLILLTTNVPTEVLRYIADNRKTAKLVAAAISAAKSRRLATLLDRLDLLFLNGAEARSITGVAAEDTAILADELRSRGLRGAVLTNGAQPSLWWLDGEQGTCSVREPENFTNVNGAGDCLAGTVLASLARGLPVEMAVHNGMTAASLAIGVAEPVLPELDWKLLDSRPQSEDA